ncbi:MAG TPA: CRISPR-associated endonuclease Cas1 [Candidatus Contendobacter sp.]|nr:CRISPR-associated endonuclease Cas1 [Candidatus Contendobacter sp.]
METLFVSREARLRQRENTLTITLEGKTRAFPIERVGHVVLLAESDLNSRLLTLCGKHGVRLSVFDYYGYYKGSFEPFNQNPSGRVKLVQAQAMLNPSERQALAQEVVRGAAHNMRANLLYYRYRGHSELEPMLKEMQRLEEKITKTVDIPTLMGVEGNLHQHYYAAWKYVDTGLDFCPRIRRPPNNPVNCLLSFLNQMTYTVVRHELFKTHLEETFSLLHSPGHGRSSLSLDLAEPFKPVLADSLIFRMTGRKMLDETWFEQHDGACLLTETGRRHVSEQFSMRLEEQYQGRSFREWVYREALAIERHLLGVDEYQSFKRKV